MSGFETLNVHPQVDALSTYTIRFWHMLLLDIGLGLGSESD